VLRTVFLMGWLRLAFFLAPPGEFLRAFMTASAAEAGCRVMVFARAPQPGEAKTRLIPALGKAGAAETPPPARGACLRAAADARIGPVELWCTPDTSDPFFRECQRSVGVSL